MAVAFPPRPCSSSPDDCCDDIPVITAIPLDVPMMPYIGDHYSGASYPNAEGSPDQIPDSPEPFGETVLDNGAAPESTCTGLALWLTTSGEGVPVVKKIEAKQVNLDGTTYGDVDTIFDVYQG